MVLIENLWFVLEFRIQVPPDKIQNRFELKTHISKCKRSIKSQSERL